MNRRIVAELLTWTLALIVAVGATLLCAQVYRLAVWQTMLVTLFLGGATWSVISFFVDRYLAWSYRREFRAMRDNDNY
ncbi:hypothetical protein [Paraburkholderia sp. GAS32]|uniref:hypothetical protein n=1 Tax=Paraburkholderia sp. GAS32 TaxID=3035129 RepID=UPI003D2323A3